MDERKRQIDELEQRKRENLAALDVLLAHLGEALFGRIPAASGDEFSTGGEAGMEELASFRQLQKDIAGSEAAIQTVEEQIRRSRELEEAIEEQERDDSARSKELAGFFGRLGKLLLDASVDSGVKNCAAPWRGQADALYIKIQSLEDRLAELEQKEGNNVFAWIGKSAQGFVMRSFLTRAQDNLEQLYRAAGERYCRTERSSANVLPDETSAADPLQSDGGFSAEAEIEKVCRQIEQKQAAARVIAEELAKLREERRRISGSFSAEGGPLKQIQSLKGHISHVNDELAVLYRRFGALAAGIGAADGSPAERKQFVDSLIIDNDIDNLNNAARINQLILDDESAIGRLRASLAIDGEKAKIEKYRRMIDDKKLKMAQAEKDITELETDIVDSEKHIEELRKLL
ncbi:MAG: hypothetical protein LBD48_10900 [Treponema sp.]|jgi:hypothetical protein|nr:hypothetical protein [Treponema sp.]